MHLVTVVTNGCLCCKNSRPFYKKGLCHECLDYILHHLQSTDIAMIISSYHHRHPKDKDMEKILYYAYAVWSGKHG